MMKVVKYKTLDEAFKNLEVKQRGTYFTCRCPHCGHEEGFFYLKNKESFVVKCNRLNHCGLKTKVVITTTIKSSELQKFEAKQTSTLGISQKGLDVLSDFFKENHNKNLPSVFRGISKETLKNYIIFYPKGIQSLFGSRKDGLFGEKYFKNHFKSRDIIIPIRDKNGITERCLLRSTKKVNSLKEFQLRLTDNGNEIWNVSDIFDDTKEYIFVCEGVFDALSIKDVLEGTINGNKFGYVALAGVGKHSQITRLLKNNPQLWANQPFAKRKMFVICFDVDKAGILEAWKFWYQLKVLDVPVTVFNPLRYGAKLNPLKKEVEGYPLNGVLDMNDWYQKDPEGFRKAFRDYTMS